MRKIFRFKNLKKLLPLTSSSKINGLSYKFAIELKYLLKFYISSYNYMQTDKSFSLLSKVERNQKLISLNGNTIVI